MVPRTPFFAFAVGFGLLAPPTAHADQCTTNGRNVVGCGTVRNTSVPDDFFAQIGGLFDGDAYPGCGTNGNYDNPQDAWAFTCAYDGPVRVTADRLECDLGMFLLDDSCDPNDANSCMAYSDRGGTQQEAIDFDCEQGEVYFIVMERNEEALLPRICVPLLGCTGDDCNIWVDHDFRLSVECFEVCDDYADNDGDGDVDCEDDECPPCIEICDDGRDNDLDNLIDCLDPDCITADSCCDRDADNWLSTEGICGGDDCNDEPTQNGFNINPGRGELPADSVDQNCDGLEECFVDADRDFYGIPVTSPSRNLACFGNDIYGNGVAANDDDCDDTDPARNPGVPEIPVTGKDENCDGMELCYTDMDADTWGTEPLFETANVSCTGGGFSLRNGDCDDTNGGVYPGAPESIADGIDSDCNGKEICYEDRDNDAYGTTTTVETAQTTCIGAGISIRNDDCNDTPGVGANIHPENTETRADGIDQDCDGFEECWIDFDRDGHGNDLGQFVESIPVDCSTPGVSLLADDCDDANPNIHPGANDPPGDGIDQNCDNQQDCYQDLDGDGWGSAVVVPSTFAGCIAPGISPWTGDCNDANNAIYPNAVERPNDGVDQDCDTFEDCYRDNDGDTYGSTTIVESAALTCIAAGVANNDDDCNDNNASVKPGATELPHDGVDQNCDGFEDCYVDNDSDGYGRNALTPSTIIDCMAAGVSPNNLDCDDTPQGFRINPGAQEIPVDRVDQNCDGLEACYTDGDLDRFGVDIIVLSTPLDCSASGASRRNDDCDDSNPDIYPGAPQGPLGGVDYDCSGATTCYQDLDNDGYGSNIQVPSGDPNCSLPGQSLNHDDCNDNNQAIHPGVADTPMDGVDSDCDGFELCFQDLDLDGYGSLNLQPSEVLSCIAPGVSNNDDDCNDSPALNGGAIHPGATEIPASDADENCDGFELCYQDQDNDDYGHPTRTVPTPDLTCQAGANYADNNDDCDDARADRHPGAADLPANRIDENCDGVDNCYQDLDGDDFGSGVIIPGFDLTCAGAGISPLGTDCYDIPPDGADIYPGAPEVAGNGIDDNCDGRELCYVDRDGDGYGQNLTQQTTQILCNAPGLSRTADDCNDTPAPGIGPTVHPGAVETPADGRDQDCDGYEDCYQDLDRDRFGSTTMVTSTTLSCLADGVAANDDDCYDIPPAGANIYPGAPEIAGNGIDENCDGAETCYRDIDGDGFGRNTPAQSPTLDCTAPGYSLLNTDCDDTPGTGPNTYPGAPEIPNNNKDNDCNGFELCYQDRDGDHFGTTQLIESTILSCSGAGVATNDDDCNDLLPGGNFIYPGAPEIPGNGIDENCDNLETCFVDADGDHFGGAGTVNTPAMDCVAPNASPVGGDCNDANNRVYPGAPETPGDDIDQNCDNVDSCYQDIDNDDFGSATIIPGIDLTCDENGVARVSGDCLDYGIQNGVRAVQINPAATEVCNGVDDDCDTLIDDVDPSLVSQYTWYLDGDEDGYGDPAHGRDSCAQPEGYVGSDGDCDDTNPGINPDADEVCDPADVDENCNGAADEADPTTVDIQIVHPDVDRDGYGDDDPSLATPMCDPGPGFVEDATDCNDLSPVVNPGRTEVPYNGINDDCDLNTPDDDLDGDGYGHLVDCNDVPGSGENVNPGRREGPVANGIDDDCNNKVDDTTDAYDDDGDGFTERAGDCNDAAPDIYPGAIERPNAFDDDCDGLRDEGTVAFDDDGDGYTENQGDCSDANPLMNPGMVEILGNGWDDDCDGSTDDGTVDLDHDHYTTEGGDCDDDNPTVYPYAPELPDRIDNDCDGVVDEGTIYSDEDGDGYTEAAGDCQDLLAEVNPAAIEVANGVDDDCDGFIDENSNNYDDDGDGYAENTGDCDDTNPDVSPRAEEVANGVDDDCDGRIDENTTDIDGDGYTTEGGDCDDLDGWRNPGLDEFCDGVDNNCDGEVDEGLRDCSPGGGVVVPDPKQCGCSSTAPTGAWWPALLWLGVLRRRRRAA